MILGLDQGTTGSTAILLNNTGRFVESYTTRVPQHFPQSGWVEHDPQEILESVRAAIEGVLEKAGKSAKSIDVMGITNQRETVTLFDDFKPLHRFIVWQDRRTADLCKKYMKHEKKILQKAGLPIDPYFSSTKIHWLLKKIKPSAKNKSIRFRTVDSFLLHQLTKEDVIEVTNASRTSLMNLKTGKWDDELLHIFEIPRRLCPKIIPSEGFNFKTKGAGFLPDGIPIQAVLGDQQAALFGQIGWTRGSGKITFGTGSFILLNTGDKPTISKHNLVSTVALQWANGKKLYALEGSAFICGAWIQWLRDQLQILQSAEESEKYAFTVQDSEGVQVVPALSGMGAPFWKPHLRGTITGLTRGSHRGHIVRASLEALCYQNRALIEAMKKDSPSLKAQWKVDGGAVKNGLLMQIQSDVLNAPLIRPQNLEATGIGVAWLAGVSQKILNLSDLESIWKEDRVFKPNAAESQRYSTGYSQWIKLVHMLARF